MKKIISFLVLLMILLLPSCGIENDGSFTYNGSKYIQCENDDVVYNFIGDNHFVKKVFTGVFRELYCLDSDLEENILFELPYYYEKGEYWIKQGFNFPTESTIADNVRLIKRYYEDIECIEIVYDYLSGVSFDDVFKEVADVYIDRHEHFSGCTIGFLYGNIERTHIVYIYNENVYIDKIVYIPSDDSAAIPEVHWYMLDEQYNPLFFETYQKFNMSE